MKFDFIIGNPPYQDETLGDNTTYAPPIYNKFMDATYEMADRVELIHPARFLFNAGSTPKSWNHKMLNDSNFKILYYNSGSKNIFPNTDIKGGIAISYHDKGKKFGPIEIFTPYNELNTVLRKVLNSKGNKSFATIIVTSYAYHFKESLYIDYPEAKGLLSKGHAFDFKSNVFERMPMVFCDSPLNPKEKYVRVLGRINNERIYKYIPEKYVNEVSNLHYYKVFLSGAIGTGQYGEILSTPIIGIPGDGATETYLSIGSFNSEEEAEAVLLYIKSKFARSLLGVLKRTQANTPGKWKYVPLQNFTSSSDIDWSQSIADIDQQLYRKYGLDEKEIEFIETHVKEMK